MSDAIRVGVVGTGRAGMVHAQNFRWHVPHSSLEVIVDTDTERAREAAEELDLADAHYASLEDALRDTLLDGVVITTPTFTHAELVRTAAEAGTHVLCEKPMAMTLAECDAMLDATREAGVVLQLAFMRRFDPSFEAAKAQIDEGRIGNPLIVRTLTRGPGLPPPWARDPKTGNGMLAEVNSHDFDTIRWLTGSDYTSVYAQASAFKAPELRDDYPDFYDTAVVQAQMANGAFGMLDGICPVDYGYDARTEVVGTQGVLFIGELRSGAVVRTTGDEGMVERHFRSWQDRFREGYFNEDGHFVDCIRTGTTPVVTGEDGRAALAGVLAATASIQEGRPMAVSQ